MQKHDMRWFISGTASKSEKLEKWMQRRKGGKDAGEGRCHHEKPSILH